MLSICIPAYNYLAYTKEVVVRLLAEDEDFEIVVVDDFYLIEKISGQQQAITELREIMASDSRVVSYSNTEQVPIQENWNNAINIASRPYIKMMGADDNILPGGVGKILKMIQSDPDSVIHGHLAKIIDENGSVIRSQKPYTNSGADGAIFESNEALKLKLRQIARFKEPVCNFYKKSAWMAVGGYSSKFRFCFDIELNVKLMHFGPSHLWNVPVAELRRHKGSDGAKLAAILSVKELRVLIDDIYKLIGGNLSSDDKRYGESWLGYRILELFLARYLKIPTDGWRFLAEAIPEVNGKYFSSVLMLDLLRRRLILKDVQKTLVL